MASDIVIYMIVINCVYLMVALVRYNFYLYRIYCAELGLYTCFCLWLQYSGRLNSLSLTVCILLGVWLLLLPAYLSRRISSNLQKCRITQATQAARLRALITLARAHRNEYQNLRHIKALVTMPPEALPSHYFSVQKQLDAYFQPLLAIQVVGHFLVQQEYSQALDWFERELHWEMVGDHPWLLAQLTHAYLQQDQPRSAIHAFWLLENCKDKHSLGKELTRARLDMYAHLGRVKQVGQLLQRRSDKLANYWRGLAHLYAGDSTTATAYLRQALRQAPKQWQSRIASYLARAEREENPVVSAMGLNLPSLDELEGMLPIASAQGTKPADYRIAKGFTPLTSLLMGLIVVVYLVTLCAGGATNSHTLLRFGANAHPFVLEKHEYWRLWSSLFLHYGWLHLVLNLLGLYMLGSFVEKYYGGTKFSIIFFAAGLSASLVSAFWQLHAAVALSVGASGAICGLLGSGTFWVLFRMQDVPGPIRSHLSFTFIFMSVALLSMVPLVPCADNSAHFSGFVVGFLLGWLLAGPANRVCRYQRLRAVAERVSLFVLLGLSLLAAGQMMSNIIQGSSGATIYWEEHDLTGPTGLHLHLQLPFTWHKVTSDDQSNTSLATELVAHVKTISFRDMYGYDEAGWLLHEFTLTIFSKLRLPQNFVLQRQLQDEIRMLAQSSNVCASTWRVSPIRLLNTKMCSYTTCEITCQVRLHHGKHRALRWLSYWLYLGLHQGHIFRIHCRCPLAESPRYRPLFQRAVASLESCQ